MRWPLRRSGGVVLILSCLVTWQAPPSASQHAGGGATGGSPPLLAQAALRTLDGVRALEHLEASIAEEERRASDGPLTVSQGATLVELLLMRGQFLGRMAAYERAEALAEQLVRDAPTDGGAFLARARARATFHRFTEALADLTEAERLGFYSDHNTAMRAAIFQAMGRYTEALALRQQLTQARPNTYALGAEATVWAEQGEVDQAERLFAQAYQKYRDVSPFPVVWLHFQQGLMWMWEGNLERARELFESACLRLPGYAAAQAHLALVEAALGRHEQASALLRRWMQEGDLARAHAGSEGTPTQSAASQETTSDRGAGGTAASGRFARAIALLRPLAESSDDPEYAGQLARLLTEVGQGEEAHHWRDVAAARYDELMVRHPEAFADHAAEFWLTVGGDLQKGRLLAAKNLEIRQTPRAYELMLRAAVATQETAVLCQVAEHLQASEQRGARLRALAGWALASCHRLSRSSGGGE